MWANPSWPSAWCLGLSEFKWALIMVIYWALFSWCSSLDLKHSTGISWSLKGRIWWRHPVYGWVFQVLSVCIMYGCGSLFPPTAGGSFSDDGWVKQNVTRSQLLTRLFRTIVFGFTLVPWTSIFCFNFRCLALYSFPQPHLHSTSPHDPQVPATIISPYLTNFPLLTRSFCTSYSLVL